MHPDEATEPIIDAALSSEKPFVVIPCCVFPTDKSVEGTLTFEDWVRRLVDKRPNEIKQARLPFAGKNLALYWHNALH